MAQKLLEDYLRNLYDIRRTGAAVPETSFYSALEKLLDTVGATLRPKVRCIANPSHGVGIPDIGLFTPEQFQRASATELLPGTKPSRGVVEAKPTSIDAFLTADGAQVSKYWKEYRQVVVTNFRDFALLGADAEGKPVKLEHYRLAPNEAAFWTGASHPRPVAAEQVLGLSEKQALKLIGERTLDVYLNNLAYWKNIPLCVWEYTIGGYQVIKKWLSYREREILGRALKMDEARAVTDIARRVTAILLMEPELDANYDRVKEDLYPWPASYTAIPRVLKSND